MRQTAGCGALTIEYPDPVPNTLFSFAGIPIGGSIMSAHNSIITTYASRRLAEADVNRLQTAGFDISTVSIIGKQLHPGDLGAVVLGELRALDGASYSCIPREDIADYEAELGAGRVVLAVHGTADEVERARSIIESVHPLSWDRSVEPTVYYGCTD
jgi:hypothetical protein